MGLVQTAEAIGAYLGIESSASLTSRIASMRSSIDNLRYFSAFYFCIG